jgi:hypothetical protein
MLSMYYIMDFSEDESYLSRGLNYKESMLQMILTNVLHKGV